MQPRKPVTAKNIFTDEVRTFCSIKQACYELNCSSQTIYAAAEGKKAIGQWRIVNVG